MVEPCGDPHPLRTKYIRLIVGEDPKKSIPIPLKAHRQACLTSCTTSVIHALHTLHLQHLVRTGSDWRPWTTHRTSTIRYVYDKQWVKWCIRSWWFNLQRLQPMPSCSLHPQRLQYSLAAVACGDSLLRMRCVWYASIHMLMWMYKELEDHNANELWTSHQPYFSEFLNRGQ